MPETATPYEVSGKSIPPTIVGFFGFDYHISLLRRKSQWIAEAKALGLTTNSWTINKEEDMSWLLSQGVNFITTDEPEKLATLLQSKK